MKKKFLTFILSICFIIPCMFMFSACSTTTPADIEFKVENGYIQYYDGSNWNNLIAIEELEGEDGDDADIWTIGNDGYWYKNGSKTNRKATGDIGANGNGIKSIAPSTDPAKTNATQTTYIITLDDNSTYEFVVKNGTNGNTPTISISDDGFWIINGSKTNKLAIGTNGEDGDDADIWTIGENGNWYKNNVDTGNKALGEDGTSYYLYIKYANNQPTSDSDMKTTASDWIGIYTGTSKTAPTTYSSYTWYCIKGKDASYSTYTITYDYGIADELFDDTFTSKEIKSTEWITNMPEIKSNYENCFLGWYIKNTNKKIENYDFVGGNVVLEARFDIEKLGLSGLYSNGKYIMNWEDITTTYSSAFTENNTKIVAKGTDKSYFGYDFKGELYIDNSVKSIEEDAFYYSYLTKVILPEGLEKIGDSSFYNSRIETIILPKSLTKIESNAFVSCSYLTNVYYNGTILDWCSIDISTLGNNDTSPMGNGKHFYVKTINSWQEITELNIDKNITNINNNFYGFDYLEKVYIHKDVESIASNAFSGCINLQSIEIEEGNSVYNSGDNSNAIIETSTNTLLFGSVNTWIPSSVLKIGSGAFRGLNIQTITIPDSVTHIDMYAFNNCEMLESVYIGKSVTAMGNEYGNYENCFQGCINLSTIVVDEENETFDSRNNCNAIIKSATHELIVGCKNTVIPNGVLSIGKFAFSNIEITTLIIPDSVATIKEDAFASCDYLTTIILGSGIETLESYAFRYSTNIKSIFYNGNETAWSNVNKEDYAFSYGTNYKVYYYSEIEPAESDNYWHYDTDGVTPVAW